MSTKESVLTHYPEYQATIGIEVHVQLLTESKIFCGCANAAQADPNTNICQVCTGQPGVLPVLNAQVIEYAIMAGIGTNSTIEPRSEFARKHYFYPDLPKGYQTTQHTRPICQNGFLEIQRQDGSTKKIRIMRIHIEEDAGKNIHAHAGESFVDLNRAGTPLLEIVTQPDIENAYEAKAYLQQLRRIVQYLGICSGNMEQGAFRADTNISVRKKGVAQLGIRCELKNINSFKFIGDAIEYEIERQINLLEDGGSVRQETRLWNEQQGKTVLMRTKEEAADYRYFADPDLPFVDIDPQRVVQMMGTLPELPDAKAQRLCKEYEISAYEVEILLDDQELSDYFERAMAQYRSPQIINWIVRDLLGYLKEYKLSLAACKLTAEKLAAIVRLLDEGVINNHAAKQVFEQVSKTGEQPEELVKAQGLEQIGSVDELEAIITQIIADNQENVAQYKAGKERIFGFFVGQAMQKTKGKGNPKLIQELLKKHLS